MLFTRPGLMEHIKVASGKFEPDMSREESIEAVRKWAKDGKEVRRIMWHVGLLNAILGEFSKG